MENHNKDNKHREKHSRDGWKPALWSRTLRNPALNTNSD